MKRSSRPRRVLASYILIQAKLKVEKIAFGLLLVSRSKSYLPADGKCSSLLTWKFRGKVGIGLLTKAVPPQKYIQVAGTCGPNADVSNEDLCARVKEWHTAHGVDILSTSADSVTLRLRKIPDDLSHFCTQLWLFDTDAFEMPQESGPVRAAALRAYAAGLRHTHIINLWWD